MSELRSAILKTLTWFELFRYPLTAFECWRYLWVESAGWRAVSLAEVARELEAMTKQGLVQENLGMWQLVGSTTTGEARLAAARDALDKRRRAFRAARFLRHLPYVRLVGLGNTLALGVAKPGSDIDLLIVVKRGRLFVGRLIVTTALHLLKWRRHGNHIADRLCLSFYLDDNHLSLKKLAYADDPYLAYWVATLVPLLGASAYQSFLNSNSWVSDRLPNSRAARGSFKAETCFAWPCEPSAFSRVSEIFFELALGWWLEPVARRLQLRRIRRNTHTRLGDGTTAVVVADGVLKFHESDRRQELAREFRHRLAALANPVL